ncbi:DNA repair protein RadA [Halobacteroides halobius DSM 5150]|uniref:DNA repair protein RadA n=1 Tax=Halobacteroides halobius (strain ATCC 35273 / DSM 5150 / MD-1) TaxID=748449 RepID=L0K715_HALHC|nr:DNA repair protein RadA [Halobacteroides halobius]AGB40169.1 DNA repair protein RadA [Halobacteroides halobius DSM 5150]
MPKQKKRYICQECGYQALKWSGQCPGCDSWNTLVEEIINPKQEKKEQQVTANVNLETIDKIETKVEDRLTSNFQELDRVLGGGIVPGSLILIGGDPGIGKSTLLLQASYNISEEYDKVMYVTGEESRRQVKLRANRLEAISSSLYILAETNLLSVINSIKELNPDLVVIDSIQTIHNPNLDSAPGSVSQVRDATNRLMKLAKKDGIPVFVVGHVTKQGSIAGPKVLEHMVDTVLYFEGDRHRDYRILRAVKNRFGSTNEVGIFEMQQSGLEEVLNPSQAFIAERPEGVSGSVIIPCLEGSRPILIELQALASSANFGTPSRMTTGIDHKRVSLILAVLEKRLGLHLQNQDVYINIVGGFQVDEPAIDLGMAIAIVSSFRDVSVSEKLAVIGEVGLSGEVRAISQIEKRVKEASKLGFSQFIIPKSNLQGLSSAYQDLTINGVANVREVLDLILGGE